jgi:transcriptional regulator with XRE-family HTH domain
VTSPDLRSRLARLGYSTQAERARAVGTSQPTMSAYERGIRPVPAHVAQRVRDLERIAQLERQVSG